MQASAIRCSKADKAWDLHSVDERGVASCGCGVSGEWARYKERKSDKWNVHYLAHLVGCFSWNTSPSLSKASPECLAIVLDVRNEEKTRDRICLPSSPGFNRIQHPQTAFNSADRLPFCAVTVTS
jgi:hypothetical protein